jgi:phage terminase small subunit
VPTGKVNEYGLNDKQEQFCKEYCIDFNGTQSAIRAGYSPKTAKEQACDLLTKPHITARIKHLTNHLNTITEKKAVDVIDELTRLIETDPSEMFMEVEQEVCKELPNGSNLTFVNKSIEPKPEYKKYFHVKIVNGKAIWELRPKDKAIELLAKIQGLMIDRSKIELSLDDKMQKAVDEIVRKFG